MTTTNIFDSELQAKQTPKVQLSKELLDISNLELRELSDSELESVCGGIAAFMDGGGGGGGSFGGEVASGELSTLDASFHKLLHKIFG